MSSSVDFDDALGTLKDNSELIKGYWTDLRASWQASESSLRRTLFYILALAAGFILLSTKAVGEVTLLGVQLTNLGLVRTLIPATIAYLIYVASTSAAITVRLAKIHDQLAEHYWPNFYRANLELTVRPVGSIGENALVTNAIDNAFLSSIATGAGMARFLIYMFVPILFDVYAIWQLVAHHKAVLWLECAVAAFSFLMILASIPNFIIALQGLND
jgi:hypothetical protein